MGGNFGPLVRPRRLGTVFLFLAKFVPLGAVITRRLLGLGRTVSDDGVAAGVLVPSWPGLGRRWP